MQILIVTTRRVWNSLSLRFIEYSSIINITRTLTVISHIRFRLNMRPIRTPGRKKIADIERELKKLQGIQHPNLETLFATSLDYYNSIPRLTILLEQRSSVTLKDVLMFSDGLRQERALVSARTRQCDL